MSGLCSLQKYLRSAGELVKLGRELMGRYETVTFGDVVVANEPLLGFRRVEIQNLLQDYGDRILNQKIEP